MTTPGANSFASCQSNKVRSALLYIARRYSPRTCWKRASSYNSSSNRVEGGCFAERLISSTSKAIQKRYQALITPNGYALQNKSVSRSMMSTEPNGATTGISSLFDPFLYVPTMQPVGITK